MKGGAADRPETFKRTASTTVILNNRDTVVIGGIMGRDATEAEWKIPLLGDIPLLGWLFKTRVTTSVKTNMFIFVTPKIIRNPAELASVTIAKDREIESVMPTAKDQFFTIDPLTQARDLTILGQDKFRQEQYKLAKEYFQEALDVDPENARALLNLGYLYEQEGKRFLAMKMYKAVIAGGSPAIADKSFLPELAGKPLLQIARERLERLAGLEVQSGGE